MLGTTKLSDLTTADIRSWHRRVAEHSGAYTASRAKSHLRSILALAEEDFGVRAASMPSGLGRGRAKAKKTILSPAQIAGILEAARHDPEHGIYYAFPFLAGTRPSEQLGLLWRDVDFERNVVLIRRIQERDGSLTEMTKTEAGTREVPMGAVLREMLLAWRVRCPRKGKELHRVFPGPGRLEAWPKPRTGGGGPILYQNFRKRYWQPAFKRLGLLRHAALGSALVHLDDAGARDRGGAGREDCWACERGRNAQPLYAGGTRRRGGNRGAGASLRLVKNDPRRYSA